MSVFYLIGIMWLINHIKIIYFHSQKKKKKKIIYFKQNSITKITSCLLIVKILLSKNFKKYEVLLQLKFYYPKFQKNYNKIYYVF